jgi:acyl-CoA synthetase (AMP-forming)/AMP-acid ligase II
VTVGPQAELPSKLPPPTSSRVNRKANATSVLILTSGTTGGTKACVLSQENLTWSAARTAEAFELTATSRYLTPLPLFHINAQVIGLLAALTRGASVALGHPLPAAKLWEAASRVQATGLSLVPSLVRDLVVQPSGNPPQSLRFAVCSSAPLPLDVAQAFEQRFQIPLLVSYGLSEAGCFVSYGRAHPRTPLDSVGKPAGCECRLSDEGELWVRGPGIFQGYDQDADATAKTLLPDGWLRTGDLAHFDDEGHLYIRGRIKDLINRGGEKLSPMDLESTLRQCPGVADVAVFGIQDARLGEEVAAAVIPHAGSGLNEDALETFCETHLAEFETPKQWLLLEAFPRGPTGKVLRSELVVLASRNR